MRRVGSYEAKTHLPRLLKAIEGGETITITRRGVPIAIISPPDGDRSGSVREIAANLRAFRADHRLEGVTLRELIDEGRR